MSFTLISPDDFYTLISAFKRRGLKYFVRKFKLSDRGRVQEQWNNYTPLDSNWWEVPMVRRRWNIKISGDEHMPWEDYVINKYFDVDQKYNLLSVGCGTGEKERIFGRYNQFARIEGIDISPEAIKIAKELAIQENLSHLDYHQGDFCKYSFGKDEFDAVLFNSSLHHFSEIKSLFVNKVLPVLKPGSKVIIFEYTGPNRFQYGSRQLTVADHCLFLLPEKFKLRKDLSIKKKNYRPGWLRMWLNDPSEAPCAESILPVLRKHMGILEERPFGGAILHPLLKGIAHNFVRETPECNKLLAMLFNQEDRFFEETGLSDFWFGVYAKL